MKINSTDTKRVNFSTKGIVAMAQKALMRSFIGLMQHKTNDLARFLEIKHRYWSLLKN